MTGTNHTASSVSADTRTPPQEFGRAKLVNVRAWNPTTGRPSPWALVWLPERKLPRA